MPAPSNNFLGFKTKELKYSTAFAVQTHIISTARFRGLSVFECSTGHYYTPHSGRNFMPSAAYVLGCSKAMREKLGGWSAEGSQRYTRTAKYKIAQMQTAVASTFRSLEPDQLAESDDIDALADFLRSWDVPEVSIRKSLKVLCLRSYADLERSDSVEPPLADCDVVPSDLLLDDLDEKIEAQKKLSKEKQQAGNTGRSELLGSDHKQARSEIRSQLQEGYYISHSGKKAIRVFTVWDVATCCLGLIIYHSHTQACNFQPPISTTVCANGARSRRMQRQIRGPQVRTLRRLPTSEFTL